MVSERAREIWRLPPADPLEEPAGGDIVVARRRRNDPWESFFALGPEDISLVVAGGVPVLVDDSLWPSLEGCLAGSRMVRVGLKNSVKHVAMEPPDLVNNLWQTPARAALGEFGIELDQSASKVAAAS